MIEFLKSQFHLSKPEDLLHLVWLNPHHKSGRKRYASTKRKSKGLWSAGDRSDINAGSS